MQKANDLGRSSTVLEQDSTLIAVIEMSLSSWLVAGIVPGLDRHPLKKLGADEDALIQLLHRWREEATKCGHAITRIAVAFEAGRDGFWLARWLRARGVEAFVIHSTSVAVPREHRRAKTDRLDTEHLKRALLGWLRGEPNHCQMAAIPSLDEEDARRPNRERENLVSQQTSIVNRLKARLRLVREQIREIEAARLQRLQVSESGAHAMVKLLARIIGVGIETADMLVHEILSRQLRDRRAVARYAGLTGAPDESGKRRREKGLARAGNARVRRGMIQLAWRFLLFQKDSALAQWFRTRAADARGARKTMIVALARKLLIAFWRLTTTGEIPVGIKLRPVA
ncbi:transposase [Bradyrhizobium sp. ISRA442]|uniref:transposase n=1 Tax=Bradyrhizobium sp. ISRA442 TaxID=2866197 RepID=UPI00311B20DC